GSYDPNNPLGRVLSYRAAPGTCAAAAPICIVPTGAETIYPSIGRSSDGEDYIEGNGGSDLIFGGLGQDDIVGGNSDFFSLITAYQRPDVSHLIFGGPGEKTERNDGPNGGAQRAH